MDEVKRLRGQYAYRLAIDLVVPDYWASRPKPCRMGSRRTIRIAAARPFTRHRRRGERSIRARGHKPG